MATDPVSAFLQGFAVVDRLETNREYREYLRERRSFEKEEQSRTRKIWGWEDDDRKAYEMDLLQQKDAQLFDSLAMTITKEHADKASAIEQQLNANPNNNALKIKLESEQRWMWDARVGPDGKPSGETLIFNELFRRLDPETRERFLLLNGIDAAAGPHVSSIDPVASLNYIPPEITGEPGGGAVVAEVNVGDGQVAPLTNKRTNRPDDIVTQIPMNHVTMTKWLGKYYTDPNLQTNIVKYISSGLNEVEQGTGPVSVSNPERDATLRAQTDAQIADQAEADLVALEGTQAPRTDKRRDSKSRSAPEPEAADFEDAFFAERSNEGVSPEPPKTMSIGRGVEIPAQESAASETPEPSTISLGHGTEIPVYPDKPQSAADYLRHGVAPEVTSGIRDAVGGDSTTAKDQALIEQVPPMRSVQEAEQSANILIAASNSKRRKPTYDEVMRTAAFVKMNYIDTEQARRFVNTGSYDAPTLRKFTTITGPDSGITTILDTTGDRPPAVVGQLRTDSPKAPPTVKDERIKEVQAAQDFIAGQPGYANDDRGEEYAADLTNKLFFTDLVASSAASQAPHIMQPFDLKDPQNLILASKAGQFQRNYNPDTAARSFTEFFKADSSYFGLGTAANIATWVIRTPVDAVNRFLGPKQSRDDITLGMMAVRNGVTGQPDYNSFATTYAGIYGQAADNLGPVNKTQRIIDVQVMENITNQNMGDNNPNGLSRNEMREEVVEAWTTENIIEPALKAARERERRRNEARNK